MPRMIEFRYVNHLGEVFQSDGYKIFLQDSDLMDYQWEYETANERIKRFTTVLTEKKIPIMLNAGDDTEGIELRNRLYEITDKDVLAQQPGRLYLGCWFLTGYVTGSEKTLFFHDRRRLSNALTFTAITGKWRREQTTVLTPIEYNQPRQQLDPIITGRPGSPEIPLSDGVLFPEFPHDYHLENTIHAEYPQYDYPHDYAKPTVGTRYLMNKSLNASDFILSIYGFVDHPVIRIGAQQYGVSTTVYEGERLVIDSAAGTVKKVGRFGEVVNVFNARDKGSSIFAKIPAGSSELVWPGSYLVELVVMEERSEPKWTDIL